MTNKRLKTIDTRISKIKAELVLIEGMRPGSLTKQYSDPVNQTGAHYQISYTHEMRSRTEHEPPKYIYREECEKNRTIIETTGSGASRYLKSIR